MPPPTVEHWTPVVFIVADTVPYVELANGTFVRLDSLLPAGAAAGANGQVQFNNAGMLGADGVFFWDNTNKRLGLGNAAPASRLDVTGSVNVSTQVILPLAGSVITVQLRDTNNNNWLEASGTPAAVNNFRMTNSATGNDPIFDVVGGDVNRGAIYKTRGTGTHQFRPGTDSTAGFQVQNATGANVVLDVDTTNIRVGINQAVPSFTLDVNGVGRFVTGAQVQTLRDTNGNSWLTATTTGASVNNLNISDAATGTGPTVSAVGTDANIPINHVTKGTGAHVFRPGSDVVTAFQVSKAGAGANVFNVDTTNGRVGINQAGPAVDLDVTGIINATTKLTTPIVRVTTLQDGNNNNWLDVVATASAVNFFEITNSATGTGPQLASTGSDTNIAFNFFTKGTGAFIFSRNGAEATGAFQVRNNATAKRILDVDTTNGRVGCFGGNSTSSTPFSALSVEDSVSGSTAFICDMNNIKGGTTTNNILELQGGNNTGVGSSDLISFLRPDGTQIGHILQNAATTVQYATSSDERIKENITDSDKGLEILLQLRVVDYNFTNDAHKVRMQGFLAQRLQPHYPEAVCAGGEDPHGDPWSVDYGRLTPLLVKAVQDLSAKVERLTKELDDLRAERVKEPPKVDPEEPPMAIETPAIEIEQTLVTAERRGGTGHDRGTDNG